MASLVGYLGTASQIVQANLEHLLHWLSYQNTFRLFTYSKYLLLFFVPPVTFLFLISLATGRINLLRLCGLYLIALAFTALDSAYNFYNSSMSNAVVFATSKGTIIEDMNEKLPLEHIGASALQVLLLCSLYFILCPRPVTPSFLHTPAKDRKKQPASSSSQSSAQQQQQQKQQAKPKVVVRRSTAAGGRLGLLVNIVLACAIVWYMYFLKSTLKAPNERVLLTLVKFFFPVIAAQYLLGGTMFLIVSARTFVIPLGLILSTAYVWVVVMIGTRFKLWTLDKSYHTGIRLFGLLPLELALQVALGNLVVQNFMMLFEYFNYRTSVRAFEKYQENLAKTK